MFTLPCVDFDINKFVDVKLPTKAQIFSRTGQRAVTPYGVFTGDDPARMSMSPTEQAQSFAKAVDDFQPEDLPAADEKA